MPFSLARKTWLGPTPNPDDKKERINNVLLEIEVMKGSREEKSFV